MQALKTIFTWQLKWTKSKCS